MKQVRKYVSNPNEIKKIFKLFPDPQINLTRHKHNLWPYYYRDYYQLNYFTDLIKKNDPIDITFNFMYWFDRWPYTEIQKQCKQRIEELKNKTDNKLIHVLWEILSSTKMTNLEPLRDYLKDKFENSYILIPRLYYIYSMFIYCYGVDFMPLLNDILNDPI